MNCVVGGESVLLPNCIVCDELVFAAEMGLSAGNQSLLPKWGCLKRIRVRYQNCVVRRESEFATEIVLSAVKQCSLLKLCCSRIFEHLVN
jgi:hypothetical protein